MASPDFKKVVRVGAGESGNVFCSIRFKAGRLSITGVEGPLRNGDARGSCGQIVDALAGITTLAPGWDRDLVARFAETWTRWHLNNMRPGCEHQRAEGWDKRPIDPSKPTNTYGLHFEGQRSPTWNMLAWVTRKEHPEGLLSYPCSSCGYKYGSAWLMEEVPDEVIAFLRDLPDADREPAWI